MAWLTTGYTERLKVEIGTSANHWNAANTQIGIGDDATAADAAQTDLLAATNKTYAGMASGYPTTPATGTVQFRAIFLTTMANYTHAELVLKNSASGVCWIRNATGWGVKANNEVWMYTVTVGKG